MVPLCRKKNKGKKNYPAACGERTNSGFPKKPKKAEKTDFEPLPKGQISFLGKMKHTKHLRIFFSTK
jgi:hypothetical protein